MKHFKVWELALASCLWTFIIWALMQPAPIQAQLSRQGETINRCGSEGVLSVEVSTASSGNVELVPLVAGERVYVCGYTIMGGGTVAVQLVSGTGTACATDETDLTGAYPLLAQTVVTVPNAGAIQTKTAAGEALCVELGGAVAIEGMVSYVQY